MVGDLSPKRHLPSSTPKQRGSPPFADKSAASGSPTRSPQRGGSSSSGKGWGSASSLLTYLAVPIFFFMGRSLRTGFILEKTNISDLEKTMEQMLTSSKSYYFGSSKKQPPLTNRGRMQHILQVNKSQWEPYFKVKAINGTLLQNYTGQDAIDVTQNVLRIQDFTKPSPTSNEKSTSARQTQEEPEIEAGSSSKKTEKGEPLNIMLFYADDWTMKVLGALNPQVMTPNLDAMAEEGILFNRSCVTTSICWISRNSLSTGVYAAIHKNVRIAGEEMFNQSLPWLETLYPLLKANGYHTGLVGKWHAPQPVEFMKNTFSQRQFYYGKHWMVRNGRMRHVTDLNGEDALSFLRKRPRDKKFSLTVSFYATHANDGNNPAYEPMNESMALYVNDTIPRPKTATPEHWKKMPWFFSNLNVGRGRWKNRFDYINYPKQIKNLYRMATEVDAVVGAIIDELKAQGVFNNTLLIFTTDNGNFHGEHGLAEKWYPWEESVKVPLIIQDPRMSAVSQGTRNDDFVLNIDLAPTILSAAHVPVPKRMQGRDIAQLYLNPEQAVSTWRQDFFYEWTQGDPETGRNGHPPYSSIPAVFALIRKDYKYFYWPQTRYEQLFRVETDPYEENDILNSTAQTTQQALQIMRARYAFLKSWAQSGNPV